jgi:hypothetical protein
MIKRHGFRRADVGEVAPVVAQVLGFVGILGHGFFIEVDA